MTAFVAPPVMSRRSPARLPRRPVRGYLRDLFGERFRFDAAHFGRGGAHEVPHRREVPEQAPSEISARLVMTLADARAYPTSTMVSMLASSNRETVSSRRCRLGPRHVGADTHGGGAPRPLRAPRADSGRTSRSRRSPRRTLRYGTPRRRLHRWPRRPRHCG